MPFGSRHDVQLRLDRFELMGVYTRRPYPPNLALLVLATFNNHHTSFQALRQRSVTLEGRASLSCLAFRISV